MKSPKITEVVGYDLCIGCGLCAALCPEEALEMKWNRYGEYKPTEVTPCTTECGLCLSVCPFADHEENEDTIGKKLYGNVPKIEHRPETGYYLASYVGYAEKHRLTSASGGIATWILERLLAEGIVDHIICVAPTGDPERLFSFTVFDTPESVQAGAGSAYYPVEMSGVVRHILERPGRYAIIGLPCFIKAIRLAQQKNKKLREGVVVTVGLVCGQLKSSHFTDYISTLAGVRGNLTRVRYRGKSPGQPASNFHFAFTTEDGKIRKIFWNEGIAEAWVNRWFTPKACSYCDDIFAECADVACMDAWLSEYSHDSQGTSLLLVRSPLVEEVVARGQGVRLNPIPIGRVVQSQKGVVAVKRQHLAYRLYLDREKGLKVLKTRVALKRSKNFFLRREVDLKDNMSAMSRETWAANTQDIERFLEAMRREHRQMALLRRIERIITFPARAFRYTRKKLRSDHHE